MKIDNGVGSKTTTGKVWSEMSVRGSLITPEVVATKSLLRMPYKCCGVFNEGSAEITLKLVMCEDDHLDPITVKVGAGKQWNGFGFNCCMVDGSTGHADSTTRYMGY